MIVMSAGSPQKIATKKIAKHHHHRYRDGPRPPRPKTPRQALGQPGGGESDRAGSEAGSRQPAEPVHRGAVLGLLHAQAPLVDGGMVGEKGVVLLDADHRGDRPGDGEHDGEYRKRARHGHDPNPRTLLSTWPTRKLHHTMKARIAVSTARVRACSPRRGVRQ